MFEIAPFITFHGIDGTGKTTAVASTVLLLRRMGVNALNYDQLDVDNPFTVAKKRVVAETPPAAQIAFYIGSALFHSGLIERLTKEGSTVVKARYLDDILAHHGHLGVVNPEIMVSVFPFKQPDLRVVLTLDEDVRRKRISQRGVVDEKDLQLVEPGSRLYYFQNTLLRIGY